MIVSEAIYITEGVFRQVFIARLNLTHATFFPFEKTALFSCSALVITTDGVCGRRWYINTIAQFGAFQKLRPEILHEVKLSCMYYDTCTWSIIRISCILIYSQWGIVSNCTYCFGMRVLPSNGRGHMAGTDRRGTIRQNKGDTPA